MFGRAALLQGREAGRAPLFWLLPLVGSARRQRLPASGAPRVAKRKKKKLFSSFAFFKKACRFTSRRDGRERMPSSRGALAVHIWWWSSDTSQAIENKKERDKKAERDAPPPADKRREGVRWRRKEKQKGNRSSCAQRMKENNGRVIGFSKGEACVCVELGVSCCLPRPRARVSHKSAHVRGGLDFF